ncbi:hypothetical protein GF312_16690 [Candidatus Poribacteria bacterium]|nr:hypothetical protein [Candidatus Poribacteria bacterium]
MAKIKIVVVVLLLIIIAAIAVPRYISLSRITQTEANVLAIANGLVRYRNDTGMECKDINDLLKNPNLEGWMGPYIDKKQLVNPWGGKYQVKFEAQEVGIPKDDPAPDPYEFDGEEEISFNFSKEMGLGCSTSLQ